MSVRRSPIRQLFAFTAPSCPCWNISKPAVDCEHHGRQPRRGDEGVRAYRGDTGRGSGRGDRDGGRDTSGLGRAPIGEQAVT